MTFKNFIAVVAITFSVSACTTIQDTSALFTEASDKSITLIDLLMEDGHYDLATTLTEQEELLGTACSATSETVMHYLESPNKWEVFKKLISGKAEISRCQGAVEKTAYLVDRIIEKYPQYAGFGFSKPEEWDDEY